MSSQPPDAERRFLHAATQHAGLSPEATIELLAEAGQRGQSVERLAVEKGLLSHADVEIVQTLLKPGEAIPGYEILSVLGRGGMGVVYRARQVALDRVVALKSIALASGLAPAAMARFEQEAQTVGRLAHPNIVTAYDYGRSGDRVYFAMEMLVGEDLGQRLERLGQLPEVVVWGLVRQVAAGLAHAAKQNFVHRDIKPANLFLVTPPEGFPLPAGLPLVKITDFGLALLQNESQEASRLTLAGSTLGTPHYMAPEQIGSPDVDLRADIYALGATAYHALSGQPPFGGATLPQIFAKKYSGELPPLDPQTIQVSPAGRALLQSMLAADPAARPANYVQLQAQIEAVSQSLAGAATLVWSAMAATGEAATGAARDRPTLAQMPDSTLPELPPGLAADATRTAITPGSRRWLPRWSRRRWLLTGGAAVLCLGILSEWGRRRLLDSQPSLVPGEREMYLFDGRSLEGLRIAFGPWLKATDREGSNVVSGQGLAYAPFPTAEYPYYSLALIVDARLAEAVEFGFASQRIGQAALPGYTLHLGRDGLYVVRGPSAAKGRQLRPVLPAPADVGDPEAAPKYHELRAERHQRLWRVYCDNQLVTTVAALDDELPLASMQVVDGEANFEGLLLRELVPPLPASTAESPRESED